MEENATIETGTEQAGNVGGGGPSDFSREMSDSDLQNVMLSAWEDPGLGSVVDSEGMEIVNKATGKPFKSMEEFKNYTQNAKKPQQQGTQAAEAAPAAPAKTNIQPDGKPYTPAGPFESIFKDGMVDYAALNDRWNAVSNVKYDNPALAKLKIEHGQEKQTQPETGKNISEEMFAEIDNWRTTMEAEQLEPLQRLADEMQVEPGTAQYDALNKLYLARKATIDAQVRAKEREAAIKYTDEKVNRDREALQFEMASKKAEANVATVSREVFGNDGEQVFWNLVLGRTDPKTGVIVERGVAADILDEKFAIATGDKVYKSVDDYQKAYKQWFANYASNPNNIRFLARQAFNEWAAQNRSHIVSNARTAGEKIANARNAVKSQAPNANAPSQNPIGKGGVLGAWGMQ